MIYSEFLAADWEPETHADDYRNEDRGYYDAQ
jgi:hypothetical protein